MRRALLTPPSSAAWAAALGAALAATLGALAGCGAPPPAPADAVDEGGVASAPPLPSAPAGAGARLTSAAPPAASAEGSAAAQVLPPESDAVAPDFLPAPLKLAGGARLVQDNGLAVIEDGQAPPLRLGRLSAPPAVSPDGARVALAVERSGGLRGALVLAARGATGWSERTLIKNNHLVDRLAFDAAGERLAFVWAGAQGGVAGLYLLRLPAGAPERLTNRAPAAPGQPPADWLPLPLRAPPVFEGETLRWTSEEGGHSLKLPVGS